MYPENFKTNVKSIKTNVKSINFQHECTPPSRLLMLLPRERDKTTSGSLL
jgi:hypothetical protein